MIARLNLGGAAYHAALLSGRRMDPERFQTLLVHGRLGPGEESMVHVAEREGAGMHYLPTLGPPIDPLADARALSSLRGTIREFRPHIVDTHTAKAGFLGRFAALTQGRNRPALVHTFNGHVLEGYFGPAKTRIYRELERGLARVTDRLLGVSDATVEDLLRLGVGSREQFRVIPMGFEFTPYLRLDRRDGVGLRRELRVADGDPLAVFVGRIAPIKRLDVMLEGLAIAAARGASLQLAIVGDGEDRTSLQALADRLGVADRTHFLGYRHDLRPIFAAADLAAISSDNEGTPVSLIEAGAAGLPGVATDVGGVAEVISPATGILVPRRDPEALGEALAALAGDPPRREAMGAAARSRMLERYSVERLIADISTLYEEVGASRRDAEAAGG